MDYLMSLGKEAIADEIKEMAKNVEKAKTQEKEINELNNKVVVDSEPVKMKKSMLALGFDGIKLTDTDVFSKSDPYVVISRRRRVEDGGWTPIRISETIKDNLNPRWSEFLIDQTELPDANEDLKIEVFDDGWKDTSIGVVHITISKLEQAHKTRTPLPITDKKMKNGGEILVRSFRMDFGGSENGSGPIASQDMSGGFTLPGGYNGTPNVHSSQTVCPPQTGYPPNASSLPYPPQPVYGSGSGGGFTKPANTLNGQMAERLEMQNQGSGHVIVTEI